MFDTRGREAESNQKNLAQAMEDAKKKYDRQLFADWVIKVFQRCQIDCFENTAEKSLTDFEKNCASNCVRKHERSY